MQEGSESAVEVLPMVRGGPEMNIVDDDVVMVCSACNATLWMEEDDIHPNGVLYRLGEVAQEDCEACTKLILIAGGEPQ